MQLVGMNGAGVAQEPLDDMACLAALADLGVQAEPATIEPADQDCVVEQPVRLHGVASGRHTLEFAETPPAAISRQCSVRDRILITRITCTSTWHRTAARTTTASASNRRGPMRGGALQWASPNRFQDTILDRSLMLCQVCQNSVSNLRIPRQALPLIIISTPSSIP